MRMVGSASKDTTISTAAVRAQVMLGRSVTPLIIIDGSGPLQSFKVTCKVSTDGDIFTEVAHDTME